jgi:ankyrin repeat protein
LHLDHLDRRIPFLWACKKGEYKLVNELLQKQVNVSYYVLDAILPDSENGHAVVLELLLHTVKRLILEGNQKVVVA